MMRFTLIAAAAFFAAHAAAQEMPKMKAGYWETSTTTSGLKGAPGAASKSTMCINEAVQKELLSMNQGMGAKCTKLTHRRDGNKYIGEAECDFSGSIMKSQSITTFSGDIAYRAETRATFTPPMHGMSESSSTQDAKYVGACPDGIKPGDITRAGRTINITDLTKMMNQGAKK